MLDSSGLLAFLVILHILLLVLPMTIGLIDLDGESDATAT